jgi:hypothetical protein
VVSHRSLLREVTLAPYLVGSEAGLALRARF